MPLFINEHRRLLVATNLKDAFTSLRHTPAVRRMTHAELIARELVGGLPNQRAFLVRNPYDRLVSFYEDKLKSQPRRCMEKDFYWEACQLQLAPYLGVNFRMPPQQIANQLTETTFSGFVEAVGAFANEKSASRLDGHLRPQTILLHRLQIAAPRRKWSLVRIEEQGDLEVAVGAKVPKMNATRKDPVDQYFDARAIALANSLYDADFRELPYARK